MTKQTVFRGNLSLRWNSPFSFSFIVEKDGKILGEVQNLDELHVFEPKGKQVYSTRVDLIKKSVVYEEKLGEFIRLKKPVEVVVIKGMTDKQLLDYFTKGYKGVLQKARVNLVEKSSAESSIGGGYETR